MQPHRISDDRTCWLFLSDSGEPRHLHDIVYAADVLTRRGVPTANMFVFTDHSAPQPYLAPYGLTQINALSDFSLISSQFQGFTAAAIVVTGHGRIGGIGAQSVVISPHTLLQSIRAIPGIKVGLVVLCQCYAGVFHRMDALTEPQLVLLGATHLNPSLSAPFKLKVPLPQRNGKPGIQDWVANIFLLKLFDWLNHAYSGPIWAVIPEIPGHPFRRDLGTDSGRSGHRFRSTWAAIPGHLGSHSGALGQ